MKENEMTLGRDAVIPSLDIAQKFPFPTKPVRRAGARQQKKISISYPSRVSPASQNVETVEDSHYHSNTKFIVPSPPINSYPFLPLARKSLFHLLQFQASGLWFFL